MRRYVDAFSSATSASLWAEPMCWISRAPFDEDHTIYTAVAFEAAGTVRHPQQPTNPHRLVCTH